MTELVLNISEIAIITGDNPYKTKREYLIDFWKKNVKDDYTKYKKETEFIKETDEDVIFKIASKNNIDIAQELKKCALSKNTCDLNNLKKDILGKIDKLPENEKKEITKSISNVTNTKYGIKNENDVTKLYEIKTGQTIMKDNKYHKIKILENDNYIVLIGGKIDGINNETKNIIEVKNRVNKLFFELREYEKVQIMCYMYLFESTKGHLVEAHKKKNGTEINIIEVDFDIKYMKNILNKITIFIEFFIKFMSNHEMKINLLTKNDEIDF